jgi:UDP-N-acetyl-D-mannosaminuronic acid dehydrogenase
MYPLYFRSGLRQTKVFNLKFFVNCYQSTGQYPSSLKNTRLKNTSLKITSRKFISLKIKMPSSGMSADSIAFSQPQHCVVMGLGYIGLPTAAILADKGLRVTGVDIATPLISSLQAGQFDSPEPGLTPLVNRVLAAGTLVVSNQLAVSADVYIIAVPTPVAPDKSADLSYIQQALEQIMPWLKPGNGVIIESTIPPGTTRMFQQQLHAQGHHEVWMAHCPERVLPGHLLAELVQNDRVVGGTSPQATAKACWLYQQFAQGAIHPTTAETAELVKVMENTYRDVNIALANELAKLAPAVGANAREVIALANKHPRVNLHQPGPGVGGHCIAVDPWFLATAYPELTPLVYAARCVNDSMPAWVADHCVNWLADVDAPVITLLGATYKPDVTDTREAPTTQVWQALHTRLPHATLRVFDPMITTHAQLPLSATLAEAVNGSDLLLVLVAHKSWSTLLQPEPLAPLMRHLRIYDTQAVIDKSLWQTAGFSCRALGTTDFAGDVAVDVMSPQAEVTPSLTVMASH